MSLWVVLAAMTLIAVAFALLPLVGRGGAASSRREHNLRVYRAQLEELRQEREQGLIGAEEAAAAELELKRRILAADADRAEGGPSVSRPLRAAALLAVLIGLPALSAGIYWRLGSPDLPARPLAERTAERGAPEEGRLPSAERLVAQLEERVERDPDDLEGWLRLGRAFELTARPARAAEAYRRALGLRDDLPGLHAAYAEAVTAAAGGVVTERAREAIERALALDPAEPRARFYRGLALAQRGERAAGLEVWVDLLGDTPADAPWRPALRQQVAALAEDLGRDPADLLAEPPPAARERAEAPRGPTREQREAAAEMSPEERQAMIRNMVEGLAARLEAHPDDVESWRRLARSWQVLGEREKAVEAYERLAALLPADSAERAEVEAVLEELGAD